MTLRKFKELRRCLTSLESFSAGQAHLVDWDEDTMNFVKVQIAPTDGPYKDGQFVFRINMASDYPEEPPTIDCLSKIYHPNIDCEGENENVCLNLFSEWQSTFTLMDTIQGLLFLLYNPCLEDPLSPMFTPDTSEEEFLENVRRSIEGDEVENRVFEGYIDEDVEKQGISDEVVVIERLTDVIGQLEISEADTETNTEDSGADNTISQTEIVSDTGAAPLDTTTDAPTNDSSSLDAPDEASGATAPDEASGATAAAANDGGMITTTVIPAPATASTHTDETTHTDRDTARSTNDSQDRDASDITNCTTTNDQSSTDSNEASAQGNLVVNRNTNYQRSNSKLEQTENMRNMNEFVTANTDIRTDIDQNTISPFVAATTDIHTDIDQNTISASSDQDKLKDMQLDNYGDNASAPLIGDASINAACIHSTQNVTPGYGITSREGKIAAGCCRMPLISIPIVFIGTILVAAIAVLKR